MILPDGREESIMKRTTLVSTLPFFCFNDVVKVGWCVWISMLPCFGFNDVVKVGWCVWISMLPIFGFSDVLQVGWCVNG